MLWMGRRRRTAAYGVFGVLGFWVLVLGVGDIRMAFALLAFARGPTVWLVGWSSSIMYVCIGVGGLEVGGNTNVFSTHVMMNGGGWGGVFCVLCFVDAAVLTIPDNMHPMVTTISRPHRASNRTLLGHSLGWWWAGTRRYGKEKRRRWQKKGDVFPRYPTARGRLSQPGIYLSPCFPVHPSFDRPKTLRPRPNKGYRTPRSSSPRKIKGETMHRLSPWTLWPVNKFLSVSHLQSPISRTSYDRHGPHKITPTKLSPPIPKRPRKTRTRSTTERGGRSTRGAVAGTKMRRPQQPQWGRGSCWEHWATGNWRRRWCRRRCPLGRREVRRGRP